MNTVQCHVPCLLYSGLCVFFSLLHSMFSVVHTYVMISFVNVARTCSSFPGVTPTHLFLTVQLVSPVYLRCTFPSVLCQIVCCPASRLVLALSSFSVSYSWSRPVPNLPAPAPAPALSAPPQDPPSACPAATPPCPASLHGLLLTSPRGPVAGSLTSRYAVLCLISITNHQAPGLQGSHI